MFEPHNWLGSRLEEDRRIGLPKENGRADTTVVAYVFGSLPAMDGYIEAIELSLRETYRWCGLLRTTLVVNQMTERLDGLLSELGNILRVDVDTSLRPGDIVDFSRNMIRTLPNRFDTPYVLTVHPDGFPLRCGLDEFVGKWDYIGGPWNINSDDYITRVLLSRNDGAGNGGFSLRTHKICEIAASAYNRLWKMIPDCYLLYEDIFYTRFLPRWQMGYSKDISLANRSDAMRFSISEKIMPTDEVKQMPFGFHSWKALKSIMLNIA